MPTPVSPPSIHDSRSYLPPAAPGRGYPPYPLYASPNAVKGYPPLGQQGPPQQQPRYLPPLQTQTDPRSPVYPLSDQRGGYYDDRRPPGPAYGQEPYPSDPYYEYRGQPPQGRPPPNRFRDYRTQLASGVHEYPPRGPGAAPQLTQAAPRQRTSIACRYCRKRKIRCSGYQSAPGGKCQHCARLNQECIFQPVSSSSSTAFVPVSALPAGVLPGSQLGAYGQPLTPSSVPAPHLSGPQQHPPSALLPLGDYHLPAQPPTVSFSPSGEARTDNGSQVARKRRRRTSEELDEGCRLPPPRAAADGHPRRRSPGEFSNHSSPGGINSPPYPGTRQSPRHPGGSTLPQPVSGGSRAASATSGRSPTLQNGCDGASAPARQGQSSSQQPHPGNSSVMSISNLVGNNDMDNAMKYSSLRSS